MRPNSFDGLFYYMIYYGFVISACIDVCLYCQYFNGVVLLQFFFGGLQFGQHFACNDEDWRPLFGIGGGDSISIEPQRPSLNTTRPAPVIMAVFPVKIPCVILLFKWVKVERNEVAERNEVPSLCICGKQHSSAYNSVSVNGRSAVIIKI